jgi:3-keto-disaccharide hydrolase
MLSRLEGDLLMRQILAFAAVLALTARPAPAQDKEKEEGFASIFNGKDLTGWVYGKAGKGENKSGVGYQVDAESKIVYCTVKDGGNLYTEKEYGDFILRFEFKLTVNANNGIGIRAPLTGDSAYVGMEIQVLDDSGPAYKNLRPEQYHGSIYDLFACKRGFQKPVGEWNEEEIYAKGSNIKVTLNGTVIVDANLEDVKDEKKIAKHPGIKNAKGHIGFLGHGARVEFRNLRVKEL